MDHPWRFPAAAAAADLCPICSTRHFPFCPPPPPPPYPFPYDLHPPPPPPPQFHPPSPMLCPIRPHSYEFPDWEAPHKRMRVGEAPPFDPYTAAQPPPPSRASAEGERLLGLIREHGRPPPPQWHGEPHQPDGFGYGGGRRNLAPNYYNHYVQGGNFTNYDDAGRLPPPPPPQESYHPVAPGFDHSYNHALEGGPHEKYLNRDRYHRQFNLSEASPGARPHLLRPPYAEAGNHLDDCGWHPEVGAVPPPPEPLMPSGNAIASPSDYCAMPPPRPASSSLFPVLSSAAPTAMLPPGAYTLHQGHPVPKANCYNGPVQNEGSGFIYRPHLHNDSRDGRPTHAVEHSLNNAKTNIINACHLFKQPLRASRPDHIVIILRGLPGSGKSYLAKALRDLEVENGGNAPRIHSMDDYFMIEVEKNVEDNGGSKSSSASKRRKQLTKKVIEYCYEPEMEETYRSSMLTAFKKTLDEGNFTFVIVDDRNLRVADFAQFWATAKKSGYEVYLLEAPYKDPTGCAARNVHGFSLHDIQMMAQEWEEAPPLYLRLDIHSLFHNDNLRENSIEEVDMDMEDVDDANDITVSTSVENLRAIPESPCSEPDQGFSKPGERWDSEEEEDLQGFKELGQSKWSKDFDENTEKSEHAEGSTHALSALVQTYGTRRKSVSWGDRLERGGFSIGAAKRRLTSSLIIGPGSGYNLACNPLAEDNSSGTKGKINNETKRRFGEQLRAESESFKAVFDRRRQRIGGFNNGDDE